MKTLGHHAIVEFGGCDPRRLTDAPFVQQALTKAAERAGATVVGSVTHEFSPHGVSCVVLIAESHLSIHTWPEHGYAAVDVFTCQAGANHSGCIEYLKGALRARSCTLTTLERGPQGEDAETPQAACQSEPTARRP